MALRTERDETAPFVLGPCAPCRLLGALAAADEDVGDVLRDEGGDSEALRADSLPCAGLADSDSRSLPVLAEPLIDGVELSLCV